MMRRKTLICVFLIFYLFFGSEIQARWIFGPPRSLKKVKISETEKAKENIPNRGHSRFFDQAGRQTNQSTNHK